MFEKLNKKEFRAHFFLGIALFALLLLNIDSSRESLAGVLGWSSGIAAILVAIGFILFWVPIPQGKLIGVVLIAVGVLMMIGVGFIGFDELSDLFGGNLWIPGGIILLLLFMMRRRY